MERPDERASQFTACWHNDSPNVMAYCRRHVGPNGSADVVAETFTAAWRRWEDVPDPALPWLIATARNIMSNARRSARRQNALALRLALLADVAAFVVEDSAESAFSREGALRVLAGLDESHREALLLVAWDGLTIEQAANVLSIRPDALRARIHRGRKALLKVEREAGPPASLSARKVEQR